MSARTLLVACAILFGTAGANAQSPATAPDPVSGVWLDQKDPGAVLNLTLDNKGGVGGTVATPHGPAPIANGSYDAKTGALKLEGKAKDQAGAAMPYVIEGKIAKGIATGTWQFGEAKGKFTMSRAPKKPGATTK